MILISGGFDPLHVGHLDLIQTAKCYGHVVAALNSDAWLVRKKGYAFMPWAERRRILLAVGVDEVVAVDDADDTVCEALRRVRPRYFANGGDRIEGEPREAEACRQFGIEQLFGLGGAKVQSSTQLAAAAARVYVRAMR